jgi:hypothetical protein
VYPPLLDKEMITLIANTLKASYYEHVMGSSTQQFTNIVAMIERIKQGVKSCRISAPIKKKGFEGKIREVDHIKNDYRGRKNQFQNYHTLP